jgi:hypothetical protein
MTETKKKKWEKPELIKLSFIDTKVNIKGKLYSLKEIVDYGVLNKPHISHPDSPKKITHIFNKRTRPV